MSGLSFTGKVVLVTGACSTVGSAVAKYFSKLGASLVLTDRDKNRLNKVGDECSGNPILKIAADLTKNEDVASVIKQTIAEFNKLDVLINYVVPTNNAPNQATLDAFKSMLNVTVSSIYLISQLAFPHLVKTRGNVVNVDGIFSHLTSDLTSCNVSRSALDELTRSLAAEFLCKGVHVNAVSAGSVENLSEYSAKRYEEPADPRTHLGPEDIAAAVVFLASDLAHFIIGVNLPVDGGKHLTKGNRIFDNTVEKNHENAGSSTKSSVPKSEQSHPDSHKKEHSHVDGIVDEHFKKIEQKNEQTKLSSARHDVRKAEADKSTTNAKHQSSEKMSMSKPASKNNNNNN